MNKGFTLVELIAVVTILGLLAIITTPAYDSISKNIKERNYESKKNVIKKQTLAYAEKYLKDKIYTGNNTENNIENNKKYYCFTVEYLIQNGIISSDSEKDEYIENNMTGEKYKGNKEYIKIYYDNIKLKLLSSVVDDNNYKDPDNDYETNNDCTYCDNKGGTC